MCDSRYGPAFEFRGSLGDVTHGRDGWRTYRDTVRRAVPDFHNEIVELVAFFHCGSSQLTAAWVLGDLDGLRLQLGGLRAHPEALSDTEDP